MLVKGAPGDWCPREYRYFILVLTYNFTLYNGYISCRTKPQLIFLYKAAVHNSYRCVETSRVDIIGLLKKMLLRESSFCQPHIYLTKYSVFFFFFYKLISIADALCVTFDLMLIFVDITFDISNCLSNFHTKVGFMMIRVNKPLDLKRPESALVKCQITFDPGNSCKIALPARWISIVKIRRWWIIFIMEIPILVFTEDIYMETDFRCRQYIFFVIVYEWCNTLMIHYIKRIWWGI